MASKKGTAEKFHHNPALVERVRGLVLSFPEVEEAVYRDAPLFKVRGKFMARIREDGDVLALRADKQEREFLLRDDPQTFFLTDHYRNGPYLLVRLPIVEQETLADLLEMAWRIQAPKKLVAAYDAEKGSRK